MPGTSTLRFEYTVTRNDRDSDGVWVQTLSATDLRAVFLIGGATVTGSFSGQPAIRTKSGLPTSGHANHKVDGSKTESTPPRLVGGTIGDTSDYKMQATLHFSEALDEAVTPTGSQFTTELIGGPGRKNRPYPRDNTPDSVTVAGNTIMLEWNDIPLSFNMRMGVRITDRSNIRDPSRNLMAAQDGLLELTNITPSGGLVRPEPKPMLTATDPAVVNGAVLTLKFDRTLDPASAPLPTAFTVSGTTSETLVRAAEVRDSTVTLTLSRAVGQTETGVTLTYDKDLDPASVPPRWAFTGEPPLPGLDIVAIDGKKVILTLGYPMWPCDGASFKLEYDNTLTPKIQNRWGTAAPGFTGEANAVTVTNASADQCGKESVGGMSASGSGLTLSFGVPLDKTREAPDPSGFEVDGKSASGADALEVEAVAFSADADAVVLALNRPVTPGEKVTVSHAQPNTGNVLWQASGNQEPYFSGRSVGNEAPVTVPQPVPGRPTGLQVAAQTGSLDVSVDRDDVDRATSYLVRWRAAGPENELNEGVEVESSNADITVSGYGQWVVRVEACNDTGCGPRVPRTVDVEQLPPGRAENFTVSSTPGELSLSATWDPVDGASSYKLRWRRPDSSFGDNQVIATETSASVTVSGYGEWVVRVRACNDAGCGHPVARHLTVENVAPPLPTLSVADARAGEGGALRFAVRLSEADDAAVTVDYATADGTAAAGDDYTAAAGTLTFAPGELEQTIEVAALADRAEEGDETFTVSLSNPSGATLADGEATGTVENIAPEPEGNAPPVFNPGSYSFSIAESAEAWTSVGSVAATDQDSGTPSPITSRRGTGPGGSSSTCTLARSLSGVRWTMRRSRPTP